MSKDNPIKGSPEENKRKVLDDIVKEINQATTNKLPYIVMIIKPANYYIGLHTPVSDKPMPDLTDDATLTLFDLLMHYVRPSGLRTYLNSAVDYYMTEHADRFIKDIDKRRDEEERPSGYLDDKL